jgi:hypothetical protein
MNMFMVAAWLLAAHSSSAGVHVQCSAKNLGLAIVPESEVVAAGQPVTASITDQEVLTYQGGRATARRGGGSPGSHGQRAAGKRPRSPGCVRS